MIPNKEVEFRFIKFSLSQVISPRKDAFRSNSIAIKEKSTFLKGIVDNSMLFHLAMNPIQSFMNTRKLVILRGVIKNLYNII